MCQKKSCISGWKTVEIHPSEKTTGLHLSTYTSMVDLHMPIQSQLFYWHLLSSHQSGVGDLV
jgi:hypothetical protein